MTGAEAWSAQVWEEDGRWRWDVRCPGLRSTGERDTWTEAWEAARAEMDEMRAAVAGVTSRGLHRRSSAYDKH